MRILHIAPTYYPSWGTGGPAFSVHTLNRSLAALGADITVYTTNMDGAGTLDVPLGTVENVDGVTVTYFPLSFRPWQYSKAMHRAIRDHVGEFDLVHITSTFLAPSTLGAHYARKRGVPYVISPRGNLMHGPLTRKSLKKSLYLALIEKKNLRGAAAIHCTIRQEKDDCREMGLAEGKLFVVPNGFDPQSLPDAPAEAFRAKHSIPAGVRVVLFLSRVSWIKGLDTLIPAWPAIREKVPEAFLVVAGLDDKGYRKEAERMVGEAGAWDSVTFTGRIEGPDRGGALAAAEAFVLPSYSESFGMAVVDAMYAKVPVVVTEGVGIASEVLAAEAGIVIPKDKDALAEAVIRLLKDPVLRKRMGENGRRLVTEQFAAEAAARKMLEAYKSIVAAKW